MMKRVGTPSITPEESIVTTMVRGGGRGGGGGGEMRGDGEQVKPGDRTVGHDIAGSEAEGDSLAIARRVWRGPREWIAWIGACNPLV